MTAAKSSAFNKQVFLPAGRAREHCCWSKLVRSYGIVNLPRNIEIPLSAVNLVGKVSEDQTNALCAEPYVLYSGAFVWDYSEIGIHEIGDICVLFGPILFQD